MVSWVFQEHECVRSTQDEARALLEKGAEEGSVVIADEQTQGRGRHGREWVSPKGNLYMSFILKPACAPSDYGQIALKIGLALGRAVAEFSEGVRLKWPNDVLIDGRKCAGILIEAEGDCLIIGMGVNVSVAPEDASYIENADVPGVRAAFFKHFDAVYNQNFEEVKEEWLEMAHPVGSDVTVKIGDRHVSGAFEGLDALGNMIVDGQTISSGDVFL